MNINELIIDIIDPNESMFWNVESLEKFNIKCGSRNGQKAFCDTINGTIIISRRGKSTSSILIPIIFFNIYYEDSILMLLDSVIDTIGETYYEMKSIGGYVYLFKLFDRSLLLSRGGLLIESLNN